MRLLKASFHGCLMAALGSGALATAQQQPSTPPAKAASASAAPAAQGKAFVVSLPLSAWDKHGKQVTDLDRNDLTLTDEGQEQVIQGLTRDSSLPFQIGLVNDTGASMKNILESARKGGDAFVDQMLTSAPAPGASATDAGAQPASGKNEIFLIHFDREVELLQDFTSDAAALHKELDEMGPTSKTQFDTQGPETTGDSRTATHGIPGGSTLYDAIFLASDELMKDKHGRKALIVVSDGLDKGSKESMNDALDAAERARVMIYTVYLPGNQPQNNPLQNPGRRGGAGYPGGYPGGGYPGGGYPGGGYPGNAPPSRQPAPPTGVAADGRKLMQRMAERTGALYFDAKRKEDLPELYGIIAKDLKGLYTITYTPSKIDSDGMFHKVTLKTTKKDVDLTLPEGYYAPGGDSE
ncbi:MAG: VWA domain-containing protein [Terracidiphilus sp.]